MTLAELQEKREKLVAEARERLDNIKSNTEESRVAELEEQHDNAMAALDDLDKQIERELKHQEMEKRTAEYEERMNTEPDPRRPGGDADTRAQDKDPEFTYEEVFNTAVRFGVSALNSEQRSLLMEHRDDLPKEIRAQATGTDSAGGYVVPQGFSDELDKALAMWGPMWDADIVRELNTGSGNEIDWPTVDDTGNTGRIKAENASVDDDGTDDVTFGEKKLNAYVFDTGMVKVPIELLQDSAFDLNPLMNELFAERLGRLANTELTTGSGSSRPNGIVTASTLGDTAASATAIASDELIDLLHSVDPAYRMSPRCRWQFNDSTLAAIRKLKDGQGNYLWQMGDIRAGEPNRLLDHPYSVNQAMASIATGNRTVIFGDHSRYVVRKVIGFTLMTLRERYAEAFQVGMVGFKRFDGELINTAAVKHLVQA